MGQYDIDVDVYKSWLQDKIITIEAMTTKEEIEERVRKIQEIEFYAEREWALLHQHYDKLTGRKGIPPWLKAERDKLITEPNIKVDWDGDPRKKTKEPKEKKPKQNLLKDLLNIDMKELTQSIRDAAKAPTGKVEGPLNMADALSSLMNVEPKVEAPKPSQEEINNKAAAMRERMRLAKEKKDTI